MKIFLINFTGGIPLGLAYLAACVSDKPSRVVRILNCLEDRQSHNDVLNVISRERPDVIGATVYTYHVNDVLSFMCETKVNNPNVKTIVGGPHPTALPQTMAASEGIDVVVRGEGEVTFRELIEKYERKESINDVDGIAYSVNGEVRINRSRELIADLDTLPYPAWSLLPIDTYKHPEYGHPRMNRPYLINMLATRGCPYSCIFCGAADVWGRKMRLHSPARIVAEMRRLNEEFGVRSVRFADSTLTVNRDWVLEICDLLVSMDIDVAWSANARASTIDEEMLTRMKHAKCKCLTLGVESGDQNVLNIAKKHQSLDEVRHAFNIMRTTGIFSWAFFMIGLPGETKESIKKTIAFAEEIDPDQVSICAYATPYPGTELYQMAMDEANIAVIPWEDFHHSRKILYVPKDLTRDDIEAGKIAFSKSLRPHKRHIGRSFSE